MVVKVKIDAIYAVELAGGDKTLQKQQVRLRVYVEGVGLLLAVLAEAPQSLEDDFR